MLPHGGVVSRELLAVPDERAEQRVVVGQQLEADSLRGVLDRDARLADDGDAGGVDLEHRLRERDGTGARRGVGVGVEAGEVGEAPVLLGLRRQRDRLVALEQLSSHAGHTGGGA